MAAFAQASRAPTPSRARQSRPPHSPSSLPFGSCNSRDHALFGPNAPTCSCKRFWRNHHRPEDGGDGDFEYPWCICGHHACFHDAPDNAASSSHQQSIHRPSDTPVDLVQVGDGVYVERTRLDHTIHDIQNTPRRRGRFTRSLSGDTTAEDGDHAMQHVATVNDGPANASRKDSSGLHISGFPSVPSICQLNSSELRGAASIQPPQQHPGLNMSMQSTTDRFDRMRASETDALREWHKTLEQAREQSQLASTIRYSVDTESDRPRHSPSRAFLDHVLQSRRAATQTNAPPTFVKAEDGAQSITDLASVTDTPDVQAYDRHLQETTSLIDDVIREMTSVDNAGPGANEGDGLVLSPTQPNTSQFSSRHAGDGIPDTQPNSIASVPMSVPSALRKLAPQLLTLKRHLAAQPNISTTIQNMSDRLWMLENASFQHVPAEEVIDKFELIEGRLLEAEHRLVELEHGQDSLQTSITARNDENRPRSSDSPDCSKTILAEVVGQLRTERKFNNIEQRLQTLEYSVPSTAYPWDIEVVLLPWSRDLQGIWYTQREFERISQNSEGFRSSSGSPLRIKYRDSSDDEDSDHDGLEYDLLFPKACGPRSKIWYRLKSRGFIKNVTITEPGARHIFNTIQDTFGEEILRVAGDSSLIDEDHLQFYGMRAPVIPLRKIQKDKQLLFLPPSELISPMLWNAEFLCSDVIHHIHGKKRLYVTGSCAYMQAIAPDKGATWRDIKSLPRVDLYSSAAEDAQDPDADYEETWWEWDSKLDPLDPCSESGSFDNSLSLNSSFSSSTSLPVRNALEFQSNSEPVGLYSDQRGPGTPQSDATPRPPRKLNRTSSAPTTQVIRPPPKRRAATSFERDDVPPYIFSPRANFVSQSNGKKRRRTSRSPTDGSSGNSDADSAGGDQRVTHHPYKAFGNGFTPDASVEPRTQPRTPYLEGREGSFGIVPRAVQQAAATAKASDAYATPRSPFTAESLPDPDERFSDTEPDDMGDERGPSSDDDEDELRGTTNARRARKRRQKYDDFDKKLHGDEEMTDTDAEWLGLSEESQVDCVKIPDSPVKREESASPGHNEYV
ncbi:hypothetical protein DBV05_g9255 [Lasiodiplodia theobromae]|uniref:Uncharacterized protein n=1 Tax=Lasiodiplodia theobromae TaxID=45133 RepID=A0A5N5D3X2_9PEZI|nr:hypothetical protein DBV05_g9255 [Lasiodiplodia theobromae]